MTTIRKKYVTLLQLVLVMLGIILFACNEDDNLPPLITRITRTDPESLAKDSTFTEAFPNRMIVIHGENFVGIKGVFFNGEQAYFNPNYTTRTSIIIVIPSNAPTAATNPNVPDKIRVVTAAGEATFSFRLLVSAPVIESISNEFALAGSTIEIKGSNLYVIDKVVFPGNVEGTDIQMFGGTLIKVTVPDNVAPGGKLAVSNTFGTDSAYFNSKLGLLCNFDDVNTYNWGATVKNDATYAQNTGSYVALEFTNVTANNWSSWNAGRSVNLKATQLLPVTELGNPVSDYALKFEMYVSEPWSTGSMVLRPRDNWTYVNMFRPWKLDATTSAPFSTSGWKTFTIPLNTFLTKKDGKDGTGDPAPSLPALLGSTGNGTFVFAVVNDSSITIEKFALAIDNIRIVKIK